MPSTLVLVVIAFIALISLAAVSLGGSARANFLSGITSFSQVDGTARTTGKAGQRSAPDAPLTVDTVTATVCPVVYTTVSGTATIVPGTADIGNHCDDCMTSITLPFSYTLYGQSFITANVSSNGNFQFTGGNSAYTNSCLANAGFLYTIFAYWDDLSTASGQGIFTSVSGTTPNRIFNIEWRTIYIGGGAVANFELRLYEGAPDRFETVYGTVANGNTTATSGVQSDVTNFLQHFCNGTGSPATGSVMYTQVANSCASATSTPTISPTVCSPQLLLSEGFESGTLDQFTSVVPTCIPGGCGYVVTSTVQSGSFAAYAHGVSNISDQQLMLTNQLALPAGSQVTLSFWQRRNFEDPNYEGGVLEISTDNGTTWYDVGTSRILSDPYNGTISSGYSNPLEGHAAWVGTTSGAYVNTLVDLSSFAGQSIKFRFRAGSDNCCTAPAPNGWWIDNIQVNGSTCPTSTITATSTSTNTRTVTNTRTPSSSPNASVTTTSTPRFSIVTSANAGSGNNVLNGVAVAGPGDVWAVGKYNDGSASQTLIEHDTIQLAIQLTGHLTWQNISQPNPRNQGLTATLELCISGSRRWRLRRQNH